jgi:hypothetical protein
MDKEFQEYKAARFFSESFSRGLKEKSRYKSPRDSQEKFESIDSV